MRQLSLLIAAMAIAAPGLARAETAALLPATGGHQEIPESTRAQIRTAITEALRVEEWTVLEPTVTAERLGAELATCAGRDCAVQALDALEVDVVVGVTIWGTDAHPEQPEQIVVQLTGIDGVTFEGTGGVSESATSAARVALREALGRRSLGAGPFLSVAGTPGAVCELDGTEIGTIPTTVRASAGTHRLRVHLEGHEPEERTVIIEADALATTSIEITLQSVEGDRPPPPPRGSSIAAWAIPVGVVGMVGGLALIAVPIAGALDQGCIERDGDRCVRTRYFVEDAGAAWGIAGGVLFVAGLGLVIAGAADGSGGASVQARVGLGTIAVEGSF